MPNGCYNCADTSCAMSGKDSPGCDDYTSLPEKEPVVHITPNSALFDALARRLTELEQWREGMDRVFAAAIRSYQGDDR
jgi:hypothetical protein